jgi:hypothetical protein
MDKPFHAMRVQIYLKITAVAVGMVLLTADAMPGVACGIYDLTILDCLSSPGAMGAPVREA